MTNIRFYGPGIPDTFRVCSAVPRKGDLVNLYVKNREIVLSVTLVLWELDGPSAPIVHLELGGLDA